MSAIFGFTFDVGRMTEVLTPDIYRAHWANPTCDVTKTIVNEVMN